MIIAQANRSHILTDLERSLIDLRKQLNFGGDGLDIVVEQVAIASALQVRKLDVLDLHQLLLGGNHLGGYQGVVGHWTGDPAHNVVLIGVVEHDAIDQLARVDVLLHYLSLLDLAIDVVFESVSLRDACSIEILV